MNQAWLIFSMIIAIALFAAGYEIRGWKDGVATARTVEAQETNTINAENTVIADVQKQGIITQGADNAYHTGITAIDNLYATARVQPDHSTGNSLPTISIASRRPDGNACQSSKEFGLTPEQCDQAAERLIALQSWVKQQGEVK